MQLIYEEPLKIELLGSRLFVNSITHHRSVRHLSELTDVMMNDIDLETHGDLEVYYMFRGLHKNQGLRYDITLIPDRKIAGECAKTYGHCHPIVEKKLTYPEIYQVLDGRAVFILQNELRSKGTNVLVVDAKKGDILFIPPNNCHVSINPGNEKLLLANIVADGFESDYSLFKTNRGAAYYYGENGDLIQNTNYFIEKIERFNAADIIKNYNVKWKDLLREFYSNPKQFEILKRPSLLGAL